MIVTRRGFLGSIIALGAAPAIVRADSLMRIVVPTTEEVLKITYGGRLLTIEMITAEALKMLKDQLAFSNAVWSLPELEKRYDRISIRVPQKYV